MPREVKQTANAVTATIATPLAWDAVPESNIAGYRLYYGLTAPTTMVDVGNTTRWTLTNLTAGEIYYFAVSAYNTSNVEGPKSETITTPLLQLTGQATGCTNNSGITITLTGDKQLTTQTNSTGNYLFNVPMFGSYTVQPSKAPYLPATGPINTIDITLMTQVYLGHATLVCPLAADVTRDDQFSTIDIVAVQRFFLGQTTGTASTGSYAFSPASKLFANVIANVSQNFQTTLFGDVQ